MNRANGGRFTEFIQKPYLAHDLAAMVRRILGGNPTTGS